MGLTPNMLKDMWHFMSWPKSLHRQDYSHCNEPAVELHTKRPCYNSRGFLLGKERAGILHTEGFMINQIFCVEFAFILVFTQAVSLQKTKN